MLIDFEEERAETEADISRVFFQVSAKYTITTGNPSLVYAERDVHLYLFGPNETVHVQGYPGFSDEEMKVVLRKMDTEKFLSVRRENSCSIGNEHEAVTEWITTPGGFHVLPYNADRLEELIQ